ncbi:hypothetical protein N7490_006511 [Penicillium lividum]|nr:hypothetical protein N7490_006511 [Penicillium lividum]
MASESAYYTVNSRLGKTFRNMLCLQATEEVQPESWCFTKIALALHEEIMVPCDLFYDMRQYQGGCDLVDNERIFKKAVLERFDPLYGSEGQIEEWSICLSTYEFERIARRGSLEDLSQSFHYIRY